MRSVVEIVTPSESDQLTTLERVKRELNIRDDASDEILEDKIAEASSDIAQAIGKRVRGCARPFGTTTASITGARIITTTILPRRRCS